MKNQLERVLERIKETAEACKRPVASIRLVAVSKTMPAEVVRDAIEAGILDLGENYIQEAREKVNALATYPVTWHFIGHVQTNKTRAVAEHFQWVHSVDRFKTARRLSEQRPEALGELNVCLQVNVDAEASKSGVAPDALIELASQVVELPRLRLRGLMCLPMIRCNWIGSSGNV